MRGLEQVREARPRGLQEDARQGVEVAAGAPDQSRVGRALGAQQLQGQREVGEAVLHLADAAPGGLGRRRGEGLGVAPAARRASRWSAAPACRPAGPWAGGGPAPPRRRGSAHRPRHGGAGARPWRCGADRSPARRWPAPRSAPPPGSGRRAAPWAGRPWRPGPSAPAPSRRAGRRGPGSPASRFSSGLASGSGVSTANSRAITRSTLPSTTLVGLVEGDRGDGGGGVGAEAGQGAQARLGVREDPAVLAGHGAGAGQQVAGAGVVAEPRPGGHHLAVRPPRPGRSTVGQRAVNFRK